MLFIKVSREGINRINMVVVYVLHYIFSHDIFFLGRKTPYPLSISHANYLQPIRIKKVWQKTNPRYSDSSMETVNKKFLEITHFSHFLKVCQLKWTVTRTKGWFSKKNLYRYLPIIFEININTIFLQLIIHLKLNIQILMVIL